MRLSELRLTHFTPRGLGFLAAVFGDRDARVVLSERADHPLTVVREGRTVLLNPNQTGLADLALAIRLLLDRRLRPTADTDDDALTELARTEVAADCRRRLRADLPGVAGLSGRFRTGDDFDGLRVTARSASVTPLSPPSDGPAGGGTVSGVPRAPTRVGGLEYVAVPGLDLIGTDDDLNWLEAAIERGDLPLHVLPTLDELPFVRVPLRFCTAPTVPDMEHLEVALRDAADNAAGLMECIRRKSEVRQDRRSAGRHRTAGGRLDPARLVRGHLAARVGRRPRVFRRPGGVIEPVFDPSEHLAVVALDLSDVWRSPAEAHRLLTAVVLAYHKLGVDLVVTGYAGRLVRLGDGREVLLHLTADLKGLDERVDEAFWRRVAEVTRGPLRLPGEPFHFHPLGAQEIVQQVTAGAAARRPHSYRSVVWWARRWGGDPERFDQPGFVMRAADFVDHLMADLERGTDGTLDTLACFLPYRLKGHARPGGFLSEVRY